MSFAQLAALAPRLFSGIEPRSLEAFFWENPHYDFSESIFAPRRSAGPAECWGPACW